jgi:hypothetical protein
MERVQIGTIDDIRERKIMSAALTRVTMEQAIAVLCEDAVGNPAFEAKLAEAARRDPKVIKVLLVAAGAETLGDVSLDAQARGRFPLVIGQPVTGIPFSKLTAGGKTINLNLIPDFLRDVVGKPVELNVNEAIDAVATINRVTFGKDIEYGNGYEYEKSVARAVASSEFKDGTIILARYSDLSKIARERKTNSALKQMNEMIAGGSEGESRCVSASRPTHSGFLHVILKDGGTVPSEDDTCGHIVVLQGFNCG